MTGYRSRTDQEFPLLEQQSQPSTDRERLVRSQRLPPQSAQLPAAQKDQSHLVSKSAQFA